MKYQKSSQEPRFGVPEKISSDICKDLNHSQAQAAAHLNGPCIVLAGPGSGKTLTIAKRIEYLLKVHKVAAQKILVITFTKYAGYDPEISSGGTSLGVDYGVYPQSRTFTVGVNVGF